MILINGNLKMKEVKYPDILMIPIESKMTTERLLEAIKLQLPKE